VDPKVLLVAPPPIGALSNYAEMFSGATETSRRLAEEFDAVAHELNCPFLDLGRVAVSSPIDGIHFDRENHAKIAQAVAEKVRQVLK
jgi:lysophospholipase L1-like esterase